MSRTGGTDPQPSKPDDVSRQPRALIHKKILDTAAARSDWSMERVSEEVSGASTTLVERVLSEYGDPGGGPRRPESTERTARSDGEAASTTDSRTGDTPAGMGPFSDRELETLSAIYEDPTASQKVVAERLGVSRATVSKRVNDIPGFDWRERRSFVESVFGDEASVDDHHSGDRDEQSAGTGHEQSHEESDDESVEGPRELSSDDHREQPVQSRRGQSVAELHRRVDGLEEQLRGGDGPGTGKMTDPELLSKVCHACIDADYITRDQEIRVLRRLLPVD